MNLHAPVLTVLPFRDRQVGVAIHRSRGLVVFDPAGQRNISDEGKIRIYLARENRLIELYEEVLLVSLFEARSIKQAWLAIYGYAAFLNPKFTRPAKLDEEDDREDGWIEPSDDTFEDPELPLIWAEMSSDQANWERSEEEGWFYED